MTNKECIEILKEIYPTPKQIVIGEYPDVADAIDMAIQALEKQEPKKPMNIRFDNLSDAFGGKCSCGSIVYEYHMHCPDCGQAIDWSE